MGRHASLISVDNDQKLLDIANTHLGNDTRLTLVCSDGGEWIEKNKHRKFDYIFADTWHGKYLLLEETLAMLNPGGFYIIDDMLPQTNWPEGHAEKVATLLNYLDGREDLVLTRLVWASGIVVAVKAS
jgi:predicted O-methyltransferase YrrM